MYKSLTVLRNSDTAQATPLPTMFGLVSAFVLSALAATSVKAHGYVQDVVIGSTHYTGYLPYSDPYYPTPPERIIRPIPGNGASTYLQSGTFGATTHASSQVLSPT